MIKNMIVFWGVWLFAFSAAANSCQRRGYVFEGTNDAKEIPAGFSAEECESCKSGRIYYWKCITDDEDEEEADTDTNDDAEYEDEDEAEAEEYEDDEPAEDNDDKSVNCMDYLRAGDTDGFAKCTGLQGKWERRGNQLIRVK